MAAAASAVPGCLGADEESGGGDTGESEVNTVGDPNFMKGVDTVVVLMMENRSFDHILGSLKTDRSYASRNNVDGLTGDESNPDKEDKLVKVYKAKDLSNQFNPPHHWDQTVSQINGGKMDGFIKTNTTANPSEVMAFHDREQLPITYWLADNFTVCDRWFSSCLGHTVPNRRYLHATTTRGIKDGGPFHPTNVPHTLMDRLDGKHISQANYYFGRLAQYAATFYTRMAFNNPTRKIERFFKDAQDGKLPAYSVIDPDYDSADDHPDKNTLARGQVFIGTVMKALMNSPQWKRMLVILNYDEGSGFYDHVVPPKCDDDVAEFKSLAFRVPAIAIGPMVKAGAVNHTVLEHTSIASTLGKRYGLETLSKRMSTANTLESLVDPTLVEKPRVAPIGMPVLTLGKNEALFDRMGEHLSSQPYMNKMARAGLISRQNIDARSAEERTAAWMRYAQEFEVVRIK